MTKVGINVNAGKSISNYLNSDNENYKNVETDVRGMPLSPWSDGELLSAFSISLFIDSYTVIVYIYINR